MRACLLYTSYWGTAAQKEMYETMCQYVQIIEQLTKVLQDKYDDGDVYKRQKLMSSIYFIKIKKVLIMHHKYRAVRADNKENA